MGEIKEFTAETIYSNYLREAQENGIDLKILSDCLVSVVVQGVYAKELPKYSIAKLFSLNNEQGFMAIVDSLHLKRETQTKFTRVDTLRVLYDAYSLAYNLQNIKGDVSQRNRVAISSTKTLGKYLHIDRATDEVPDEQTILGWFKEIWGAETDKKLIEKLIEVSENYPIVLNLGLLQYKDENTHNDILKGMLETEKETLLQAHPKFKQQLNNFNQIKDINKFKDYIDNTIKTMEIKS